jgi:hypothetical protein
MDAAAEGGHEAIVRWCYDMLGASSVNGLNSAMAKAAEGGNRLCGCSTTSGTPMMWMGQ